MSTNNFSFNNILVVIPDFNFYHESEGCDCENKNEDGVCKRAGDYIDFDQWGHDNYIEEVQKQLQEIGFDSCDKYENGGSYGGKVIAQYGVEDKTGMIKWLEVVIRSGYYSGANIDYTIDGDFADGIPRTALDKTFNRLVRQTEEILRKNGTEMLKVGQFSNGEAFYELKNKTI